MHNYAIINHNRANIGRWIGLASLAISFAISFLLLKLSMLSESNILTSFTVSSGAIYFCLYLFFNKILWKKILKKLPNIHGTWLINGDTLDHDGNITHSWSGNLDIEQTWDEIAIILKTDDSSSQSYTATLRKEPGSKGGWILYYSYTNEPSINRQNTLSAHKGFCEINFNENNKSAMGSYFNNFGRYTFGKISLNREV